MSRMRYRMLQDFLHVVLMGLAAGVIFSMAVTGVVFLLSGKARVADEPPALGSPYETNQNSLLLEPGNR
jgi:hypothetical protein